MREPYHFGWLREREAKLQARSAALTLELEQVQDQLEHVQGEMRAPMTWSIDDLELSVRAYNCLKMIWAFKLDGRTWTRPTTQITTVGELVQWSASDLLKIKNCGRSTVEEIETRVSGLGLALRVTAGTILLQPADAVDPQAGSTGKLTTRV